MEGLTASDGERGNITIATAGWLTIVLALIAGAVDFAVLTTASMKTRAVAEAMALTGAQEIDTLRYYSSLWRPGRRIELDQSGAQRAVRIMGEELDPTLYKVSRTRVSLTRVEVEVERQVTLPFPLPGMDTRMTVVGRGAAVNPLV